MAERDLRRRAERRRNRVNIRELFISKDEGYDDECIEEKLRREKDEMLHIIIDKNQKIERLKNKKEDLERKISAKDESLKKFQDRHTKLLMELSKNQKQRWLILHQKDQKDIKNASPAWKCVRDEAQDK